MTDPRLPEGFTYYPDLITEGQETALLAFIEGLNLQSFVFRDQPSRRQVRNFGVDFDYDRKVAVEAPPIPHEFDGLLDAIAARTGTPRTDLAELLVTHYPEGAEITWHRDSRAFQTVFGVSLLSDAPLQLRPYSNGKRDRADILRLMTQRRSLYVLDGPARSAWMHRVPPVKSPRYSITLRSLRPGTEIFPAADLSQYRQPGDPG